MKRERSDWNERGKRGVQSLSGAAKREGVHETVALAGAQTDREASSTAQRSPWQTGATHSARKAAAHVGTAVQYAHLCQQCVVLLLVPLAVLAQVLHYLALLLLGQQAGRARPPVELEEAVVRRPADGGQGWRDIGREWLNG